MDFTPLIPFVAVNALCLALAWILARRNAFYRDALDSGASQRFLTIDGLRGFLALGVFFAHVTGMRRYYETGLWGGDGSGGFYAVYSSASVSLFFMITGFLFWSRVLKQGSRLDSAALYVSRIRRLVPMYLASVALTMLVVAWASGFHLQTGPFELLRQLRSWLSFGFMDTGAVNGVQDARLINAVYWTLAYEWMFYLSLPLLALFSRGWLFVGLCAATLFFGVGTPIVLNFLAGALTALAVERWMLAKWLARRELGLAALACLAALFAFPSAYAPVPVLLMSGFFIIVVAGNDLFGLLVSRPARLLGLISYSVYLVHCIVVYVVIRLVNDVFGVPGLDPTTYWTFGALAALGAVALSALTYRYVEHPFIVRATASGGARKTMQPAFGTRIEGDVPGAGASIAPRAS